MSDSKNPVLSIVAPVFNEEKALPAFHERLMKALEALKTPFEILYVDDGSSDGSVFALRKLRGTDDRVKILQLSRNFGHQLAITCGMDYAKGQACVIMDSDGQDPPEEIHKLVAAWKEGWEVVYAIRTRREGEGLFKRATAALFYRLMRRITSVNLPLDAGDFRLIDAKVLKVLRRMRETHRFVRGLTSWVGFKQTSVEYVRLARIDGETHYPVSRMVRLAIDAITSFSNQPLRWMTFCGLGACGLSFLLWGWVLYVHFFVPTAVRGWASTISVIITLGGLQLFALGLLGEYMVRVFDEVKLRPLYIVREAEGIPLE